MPAILGFWGVVVAILVLLYRLESRQASELLGSSVYLLGDAKVLLSMMERVASIDGSPTVLQRGLVEHVRASLAPEPQPRGTWG